MCDEEHKKDGEVGKRRGREEQGESGWQTNGIEMEERGTEREYKEGEGAEEEENEEGSIS